MLTICMRRAHWLRFVVDEGSEGGGGRPGNGDEFTPITTQEDLNKVIKDRVARERGKFADYNDLKAKAAELDKLKASTQSETDKLASQIADLQTQLEGSNRTAMRARIQAKHGISDEDAELFLTAGDEDTLARQAEALAARTEEGKKKGPVVPTQGNHPKQTQADQGLRDFSRSLFGRDT